MGGLLWYGEGRCHRVQVLDLAKHGGCGFARMHADACWIAKPPPPTPSPTCICVLNCQASPTCMQSWHALFPPYLTHLHMRAASPCPHPTCICEQHRALPPPPTCMCGQHRHALPPPPTCICEQHRHALPPPPTCMCEQHRQPSLPCPPAYASSIAHPPTPTLLHNMHAGFVCPPHSHSLPPCHTLSFNHLPCPVHPPQPPAHACMVASSSPPFLAHLHMHAWLPCPLPPS